MRRQSPGLCNGTRRERNDSAEGGAQSACGRRLHASDDLAVGGHVVHRVGPHRVAPGTAHHRVRHTVDRRLDEVAPGAAVDGVVGRGRQRSVSRPPPPAELVPDARRRWAAGLQMNAKPVGSRTAALPAELAAQEPVAVRGLPPACTASDVKLDQDVVPALAVEAGLDRELPDPSIRSSPGPPSSRSPRCPLIPHPVVARHRRRHYGDLAVAVDLVVHRRPPRRSCRVKIDGSWVAAVSARRRGTGCGAARVAPDRRLLIGSPGLAISAAADVDNGGQAARRILAVADRHVVDLPTARRGR